jgi:hypothetical protein
LKEKSKNHWILANFDDKLRARSQKGNFEERKTWIDKGHIFMAIHQHDFECKYNIEKICSIVQFLIDLIFFQLGSSYYVETCWIDERNIQSFETF